MSKSKKKLSETRASFRLNTLAGFRPIQEVNIPEIPTERTLFPGTKNDYWYRVDLPQFVDASACIYELDVNGVFEPHYHQDYLEHYVFFTENAKVEVVTDKEEYFVEYPNGCVFDKGVPHAVINKSDFKIEILVIWKPKMLNGWTAKYLQKQKT